MHLSGSGSGVSVLEDSLSAGIDLGLLRLVKRPEQDLFQEMLPVGLTERNACDEFPLKMP